jgi:type II secretory pathway predicted ATPase ExeA
MYTAYFGLKEKPFSIAPDPQYLFMSDRHREALAHLTYGLGDAGGFVLLTGEVGTGKTTVSRCLMERLPENTQAAFILNPTLSSHELLATICDELKIRYRKTGATLKTLTDKIQDKLLKNHANDLNTLLIIDEAQHLQPEVLEQLRLLTNLETNTKKLLQVILIGQPELQTLLKRRDLRQLAQRITARYHLLPLNREEVAQYIKHRLSIAECIRSVFSPAAMKALHDICGGIPRLINLVSERSLINAYSANVAVVDKKIVLISAQEALGDEYQVSHWWQSSVVKWLCVFIILGLVSASAFFFGMSKSDGDNSGLSPTSNDANLQVEKLIERSSGAEGTAPPILSNDDEANKKISTNVASDLTNEAKIDIADTEKTPIKTKSVLAATVTSSPKFKVDENKSSEVKPFEMKPVEGVSNELFESFNKALEGTQTSSGSGQDGYDEPMVNDKDLEPIENMPAWVQNNVPTLQFEQHIYSSDGKGWVKVNGRDRYEGDNIARELILVRILPQKVVLNFRGEKFTMQALSSR